MVKARPILMSGPMVRACLAGTKTQTRRVVSPGRYRLYHYSPTGRLVDYHGNGRTLGLEYAHNKRGLWDKDRNPGGMSALVLPCPYGLPGDLLYVREAWAKTSVSPIVETIDSPWTVYRVCDNRTDYGGPWKPGIHMRRSDSRLTLRITDVRVERLQDISEADAQAEGAARLVMDDEGKFYERDDGAYRMGFYGVWEHINGKRAPWDSNPWVWCLSFDPIRANVDSVLEQAA